jgi:hypothetical protein
VTVLDEYTGEVVRLELRRGLSLGSRYRFFSRRELLRAGAGPP